MAGVTESNEFQPTPQQTKMAELLANPDEIRSKEEICEAVGVTRTTLWRWEQKPEFRAYVNDLVSQYTDSAVPKAWRALINRMGNDTQAIKLFFELKNLYRDRKEITADITLKKLEDFF